MRRGMGFLQNLAFVKNERFADFFCNFLAFAKMSRLFSSSYLAVDCGEHLFDCL